MLDLRSVRDAINEALAAAPLAATWLYVMRLDDEPKLHIAILPLDTIVVRQLSEIGEALHRAAGTDAFITNIRGMAPARAQDLMDRAVLIDDRRPDVRREFAASLALRHQENALRAADLEIALDELRVSAMLKRASQRLDNRSE